MTTPVSSQMTVSVPAASAADLAAGAGAADLAADVGLAEAAAVDLAAAASAAAADNKATKKELCYFLWLIKENVFYRFLWLVKESGGKKPTEAGDGGRRRSFSFLRLHTTVPGLCIQLNLRCVHPHRAR